MLASINCTTTRIRIIRSKKRLAGRTCDANFYEHSTRATDSPIAMTAMQRIGELYGIEEQIRGQTPGVRRDIRQARSVPLLNDLYRWFKDTLTQVSAKSDLAIAIRYAMSRWKALTRFAANGIIEIDNNGAERALRSVALGRKNYLFAGSDAGGERAAAIYSLVGSAKLLGIDPQAYLRHVIERIADHPVNPYRGAPAVACGPSIGSGKPTRSIIGGVNAPRPDAYAVIVLASGKTTKSEQANRSD